MSPLVSAIAILGAIALSIAALHRFVTILQRDAVLQDRLDRLREEAQLSRKQREAMQKDVTNEDVARSLDDGSF